LKFSLKFPQQLDIFPHKPVLVPFKCAHSHLGPFAAWKMNSTKRCLLSNKSKLFHERKPNLLRHHYYKIRATNSGRMEKCQSADLYWWRKAISARKVISQLQRTRPGRNLIRERGFVTQLHLGGGEKHAGCFPCRHAGLLYAQVKTG
jgi:hypothetical protein